MFRENRHLYPSPPPIPPFQRFSIAFDFRDDAEDLSRRHEGSQRSRGWYFPMRDVDDRAANQSGRRFILKERPAYIHAMLIEALQGIWYERISIIKQCVGLRHLEIDLEECHCPLGCCRMAEWLLCNVGRFPTEWEDLKQLQVTGLGSVDEAYSVMDTIMNAQGFLDDGIVPPAVGLFLADQFTVEGVRIPRLEISNSGLPEPARAPDFEFYRDLP